MAFQGIDDALEIPALHRHVRRLPNEGVPGSEGDPEADHREDRGIGPPVPDVGDLRRRDTELGTKARQRGGLVRPGVSVGAYQPRPKLRGFGDPVRGIESELPLVPTAHVGRIVGQEGDLGPRLVDPTDSFVNARDAGRVREDPEDHPPRSTLGDREEVAEVLVLPDPSGREPLLRLIELATLPEALGQESPAVARRERPVEVGRHQAEREAGHDLAPRRALTEPDAQQDSTDVEGEETDGQERKVVDQRPRKVGSGQQDDDPEEGETDPPDHLTLPGDPSRFRRRSFVDIGLHGRADDPAEITCSAGRSRKPWTGSTAPSRLPE